MQPPPKDLANWIDAEIRRGNSKQARQELRKIDPSKVKRDLACRFANLSRRANLPALAVRFLHGIVRGSEPASSEERAEYAAALTFLGAGDEAIALLRGINRAEFPLALLYESFAHFTQWNYKGTLVLLDEFIRAKDVDPYMRLVGRVNLATALVYERLHAQADKLLGELLEETQTQNLILLKGNILELAAQNAILQSRFTVGEKFLFQSLATLRGTGGLPEFLVRKWTAVLELMKDNSLEQAQEDLKKIKFEAKERSHWETARDCDHFLAVCLKNTKLAVHLFYGTPYESFRRRLMKDFPGLVLPDEYFLKFSEATLPREIIDVQKGIITRVNPANGEVLPAGAPLAAGTPEHRALVTLGSDFYSPFRIPFLFSKLFPGEAYHPLTSAQRVNQSLKKLREWLAAGQSGLAIIEEAGTLSLHSDSEVAVKISKVLRAVTRAA